jgi:hypothetical protein
VDKIEYTYSKLLKIDEVKKKCFACNFNNFIRYKIIKILSYFFLTKTYIKNLIIFFKYYLIMYEKSGYLLDVFNLKKEIELLVSLIFNTDKNKKEKNIQIKKVKYFKNLTMHKLYKYNSLLLKRYEYKYRVKKLKKRVIFFNLLMIYEDRINMIFYKLKRKKVEGFLFRMIKNNYKDIIKIKNNVLIINKEIRENILLKKLIILQRKL